MAIADIIIAIIKCHDNNRKKQKTGRKVYGILLYRPDILKFKLLFE